MARTSFVKPIVVVSRCLTQAPCRWDGDRISYPFARLLRQYVRLVTVCPEVEIGLGVPRDKVVLVEQGKSLTLLQPATGRQLTRPMIAFSKAHLAGLDDVDGFLLKSRSPSCGVGDTKRLGSQRGSGRIVSRGPGVYAAEALKAYPSVVIEDERRLEDHAVREHWLTRLFTSSAFRAVRKRPSVRRLEAFHRRHTRLLHVYNKPSAARLDKLVGALERKTVEELVAMYGEILALALRRPARVKSLVESMAPAYNHYSPHLVRTDKRTYGELVHKCLARQVPVNDLRKLIQVWAVRYDKNFTREHSLFRPYPGQLAVVG